MPPFEVIEGDSPIILGQPHVGTWLPDGIADRLTSRGQELADTDWHIDRLYDGLLPSATVVKANFHRYLIDANRDPEGQSLYPGQNTTNLCPVTDFDGQPIWREGQEPNADEIAERRDGYHRPYHQALADQIERVKAKHGVAILYDCHSIRSEIPFLFEGLLPVYSIGTNVGTTCDPAIERIVTEACRDSGESFVVNGRFKGGWTTRHYANPEHNVHTIQMELAQRAYLSAEKAPWEYNSTVAAPLRQTLAALLASLETAARSGQFTKN
ncbi:N-formylglutamate deformylase [Ruegeria sp.]|uniref:N-formylglutamate deformylase n=1 Tax=Ruegeria sp. TaxID=1879320 RepID=UPI003C7B2548